MREVLGFLFVTAFLFLATESARVVRTAWFGRPPSVLARYEEQPGREDPAGLPVSELARRYEVARRLVAELERTSGPAAEGEDEESEPYASARWWKVAIEEREEQLASLAELRYYCLLGGLLAAAGTLCFARWNDILGVALMVSGFTLLIVHLADGFPSFAQLRLERLVFVVSALALLLASGHFTGIFRPLPPDPQHEEVTQ
jgi:hypothetical protein